MPGVPDFFFWNPTHKADSFAWCWLSQSRNSEGDAKDRSVGLVLAVGCFVSDGLIRAGMNRWQVMCWRFRVTSYKLAS